MQGRAPHVRLELQLQGGVLALRHIVDDVRRLPGGRRNGFETLLDKLELLVVRVQLILHKPIRYVVLLLALHHDRDALLQELHHVSELVDMVAELASLLDGQPFRKGSLLRSVVACVPR